MFTEPSCTSGKQVYLTWKHANYDAKVLRRKGSRTNPRPYPCRSCHKYHVGGQI